MTLVLLFLGLIVISVYWFMTQIRPEQQRTSLLRPGYADGLLEKINAERHSRGLSLLELDEGLLGVAENKATHQLLTGVDDEGWDYPREYAHMMGKSLFLEALFTATPHTMGDRLARQTELFENDWICCGIGVAGGNSGKIVCAVVLCRETWDPSTATAGRSFMERLVLGDS